MSVQEQALLAHDVYPHIRIVMGMVIGLGVTRLLSGVARIVQHPEQQVLYPVHLAWVASVLLSLVHFWWWEFALFRIDIWTFGTYLFVISYAIVLFMQCALLFPDSLGEYADYKEFFLARRAWFFGLLATSSLFDVVDTLIKGKEHFERFAGEYMLRTPIMLLLCFVAARTSSQAFHVTFVAMALTYQLFWIFRLTDTLI
ncbi:hypothetical protein [Brachymonas denitrificans]|uniref:hypothetical protein n=1 Tax=Brachymonas denitrificans TaxID=28220 RepID=UPI002AFFD43E|nr:hypothetical protein [Brachymonas denitrificans]